MPKSAQPWVLTLLGTVFAQSDPAEVRAQFERVVDGLEARFPKAASHLAEARDELLAFTAFPARGLAPDLVEQPAGAAP